MSYGTTLPSQSAVIAIDAYIGPGAGDNQLTNAGADTAVSYRSGASLTGVVVARYAPQLAAAATNVSFNLATIFNQPPAGPIFISIVDATNPGVGFSITTTGGTNWTVAPNGIFLVTPSPTADLPTVVISNSSATSVLNLKFAMISQ